MYSAPYLKLSLTRRNRMNSNPNECATKPTIQTVLERINALEDRLQNQIGLVQNDVALLKNDVGLVRFDLASFRDEFQLFRGKMEIRMDRAKGMENKVELRCSTFALTSRNSNLKSKSR